MEITDSHVTVNRLDISCMYRLEVELSRSHYNLYIYQYKQIDGAHDIKLCILLCITLRDIGLKIST